jgi:hypothetical protein
MARHPESVRLRTLLGGHEYERVRKKVLEAQKGKCAICGRIPGKQPLCLDHDHKTNRIRGLLCNSCNVKLGWFENHFDEVAVYLLSQKHW